jgi:glycosyltransferase involved in cell wall biosynthesis
VNVALVHDYLTQRGGAERVALTLKKAFPGAPLHTSLYEPELTFPEFREVDVQTLPLNCIGILRRNHRLALPLLAPSFSRLRIDADVVVCSSSGWAHAACAAGRKIVYCHAPARWLYQPDVYFDQGASPTRAALAALRPALQRWDERAAQRADLYLVNSSAVRDRVLETYGIVAEVVPPPVGLDPSGERRPVAGIEPGFALCVSRLLPYKNVGAVVEAFAGLPDRRLVVVGTGPDKTHLRSSPPNVSALGAVEDDELRWLYDSASAVISAAYEDFGLTPVEGATFGKPAAVLRFGGHLDTVAEEETGVFFDRPDPAAIRAAVRRLDLRAWDAEAIRSHAARYSEERFIARLREVVAAEGKTRKLRRRNLAGSESSTRLAAARPAAAPRPKEAAI